MKRRFKFVEKLKKLNTSEKSKGENIHKLLQSFFFKKWMEMEHLRLRNHYEDENSSFEDQLIAELSKYPTEKRSIWKRREALKTVREEDGEEFERDTNVILE